MSISAGKKLTPLDGVDSDVAQKLRRDHKSIGFKYASYVRCIRKLLQEKQVSTKDLYSFLQSLPFEYDQSVAEGLRQAKTPEDIFITLQSYYSFWDYEIFQSLIEEYNLDKRNKTLQYPKHFKSYTQKLKVSEFIAINPSLAKHEAKSKDSTKLNLKFDIDIIQCSLDRVNELKEVVANAMDVKASTLRLLSIQEGCMDVSFLVPSPIADSLDWKQISERSKELRDAGVLSITCNDKTLVFKEELELPPLSATSSKCTSNQQVCTVEPPNKGHFGTSHFVLR